MKPLDDIIIRNNPPGSAPWPIGRATNMNGEPIAVAPAPTPALGNVMLCNERCFVDAFNSDERYSEPHTHTLR